MNQPIATEDPQAPAPSSVEPPPPPTGRFYRVNPRKLRFSELNVEGKPGQAFWVYLIFQTGIGFGDFSLEDCPVESITPFEVSEEALEPDVRRLLSELAADLHAQGFHSPVFHHVADFAQKTDYFLATYAHRSRPLVACCRLRVWHVGPNPKVIGSRELLTAFADGTAVRTSGGTALDAPASCRLVRLPGAGLADLLAAHERAMSERASTVPPLPAGTAHQARDVLGRVQTLWRDHSLARGLFAEPRPGDVQRRDSLASGFAAAARARSRHPAVYAEIEALQRRGGSWLAVAILLLVSLGVFVLIGFRGQSLLQVLAIVPILLFHELGHFITMKAFGYRNLRMFFIPGLGAAVTGRHYNVPGWKKAIVYLMGPLPGILLGTVVGLVGMVAHTPLLVKAGLLTVVLNGFNLIPLLPLDGGHVAHLILFSRSRFLDIGFRVLAALALMALAVMLKSYILIGIGAAAFAGLGVAGRMQRVVAELRREGVPTSSEDDQTIPVETADRITDKLLAGTTKPPMAKMLAVQVTQAFEALNTRPPRLAASLGLGAVHLLGFVAAVFFTLVFAFSQNGKLRQYAMHGANQPRHALVSPQVLDTAPPQKPDFDAACASFATTDAAEAAFTTLQSQLGPGESVSRFANSVVLRYPAGDDASRRRALEAMRTLGGDTFIMSAAMNAQFRFQFIAPQDDVEALARDLSTSLNLPFGFALAAPWSPQSPPSAEHQRARATYSDIQAAFGQAWRDPKLEELRSRMEQARREGETAVASALEKEETELAESLRLALIRDLRHKPGSVPEVVDAYLGAFDASPGERSHSTAAAAVAPLLGAAAPGDLTYVLTGYTYNSELIFEVYIAFADPVTGADAFSKWLTQRKVSRLRYDLQGVEAFEPEPE
jgi:Zn-dependent protease